MKKKKIKPKLDKKYSLEQFGHVIPSSVIERILTKRDLKKFNKFMTGQTVSLLEQQGGIYAHDLERFINLDWDLYD